MLPVDPRPVVIGTMGLPSTEGADGLGFFPKTLAALNLAGANIELLAAPSAARNERRFQLNFKPMRTSPSMPLAIYLSADAAGGFTTNALPTISISESPGIHSRAMQARDGALPGRNRSRRSCSTRRTALCGHRNMPCRSAWGCRRRGADTERPGDA